MLIVALLVVLLLLGFCVVNLTIVLALATRMFIGATPFRRTVLLSLLFSILLNGVGVFLYLAMGADRLAMAQQDPSGNEFRSWTSSVAWFMSAQVLLGTLAVIIGLYRSIVAYRKRLNRKRNVWVILVLTVHAMAIVLLILV
jgi:uncharacterized membrane protein